MMWARKRWTSRVFAAVLCLSMLPTLIVPGGQVARDAHFGSYERWVRAQLRIPVDDAVERAIQGALESEAASFDEFIAAFLDAYAAAAPGRSISQVFVDRDLSNEALITFLQRRYSQFAEEGILPRLSITSVVSKVVAGHSAGPALGAFARGASAFIATTSILPSHVERAIVVSFRVLSSARSLGP